MNTKFQNFLSMRKEDLREYGKEALQAQYVFRANSKSENIYKLSQTSCRPKIKSSVLQRWLEPIPKGESQRLRDLLPLSSSPLSVVPLSLRSL